MRTPPAGLVQLAAPFLGTGAEWSALAGDGSDRLFWRAVWTGGSLVASDGSGLDAARTAENASLALIGRHLAQAGLPVARMLAAEPRAGLFVMEDLGSVHLADAATRPEADRVALYRPVVEMLVQLQERATPGFDTDWCCQTERYDRDMVRTFESGYFVDRLVGQWAGLDPEPEVNRELDELAGQAAGAGRAVFLHRDFQSRNIMLTRGRPRVIDFQAARLGPPGYDLASLLIDPYVGLNRAERRELKIHYLEEAAPRGMVDPARFDDDFQVLALHRNFQMLGAFAFLSRVKGRRGFAAHIPAALTGLAQRLTRPRFDDFPRTRALAVRLAAVAG